MESWRSAAADVAVELLQAETGDEYLAEHQLGDGVHAEAARLALARVVDEHRVQHLLVAQHRGRRELRHAVREELEHVLVLAEGEVAEREARLEHGEVGAERARVDAVDRERALEAPQGVGHAAQGRARDVELDALVHDVVEQPVDEALHAERQPEGVEPRLAVVAVDGGDAGGDVPLLVDVLGDGGRAAAQNDGLEMLEHRERGVEQQVALAPARARLPARQRPLEPLPRAAVEREVVPHGRADVVAGQGVLAREQLVRAHEQRHTPPGDGLRGPVAVAVRRCRPETLRQPVGRQRDELVEHAARGARPRLAGQRGERVVRPLRPGVLAAHRLQRVGRHVRLELGRVEREPVREHGPAERDHAVGGLRMHLLAQEVHERVAPAADLVDLRGDGAQLALRADLVEVHRQRAEQLLGDEVDGLDVGARGTA